jgi:MOSC domain-containing protein YiiM
LKKSKRSKDKSSTHVDLLFLEKTDKMKIVSIQVGKLQQIPNHTPAVLTGIFKTPVSGPVEVRKLGLQNDEQADLKVHGGFDKAVYAYSFEAYSWWVIHRPEDSYSSGAFGENLTIDEIHEDQTFIGDTFALGSAILQVSEPRFPCFKLGLKYNDASIIKRFMQSRRPGIYFRVLQEGRIQAGDELRLIAREKISISILELFELKADVSIERLREMIQVKSLPERWRNKFLTRISSH